MTTYSVTVTNENVDKFIGLLKFGLEQKILTKYSITVETDLTEPHDLRDK